MHQINILKKSTLFCFKTILHFHPSGYLNLPIKLDEVCMFSHTNSLDTTNIMSHYRLSPLTDLITPNHLVNHYLCFNFRIWALLFLQIDYQYC